jgi:entry exclusion lipoprotein TrbK
MKKSLLVLLMTGTFLLAACHKEVPKSVSCSDSKVGKTKEELRAIADACFLQGTFTPSPVKNW